MTEAQINQKIDFYSTAIDNLLQTGQRYEIGTGPSKRVFEMADIGDLEKGLNYWESKLKELNGTTGVMVGF